MNHKPGSVAKGRGPFADCHLSWAGLAAGLCAAYPRHWTGRPAAAWLCSWWGLPWYYCTYNAVTGAAVGSYPAFSPLPGRQ